jgi:hypothetical protein
MVKKQSELRRLVRRSRRIHIMSKSGPRSSVEEGELETQLDVVEDVCNFEFKTTPSINISFGNLIILIQLICSFFKS